MLSGHLRLVIVSLVVTLIECNLHIQKIIRYEDVEVDPTVVCGLPPVTGFCRGYFPMFYYESHTRQCQNFTYGGCGGNDNRFETLAECTKVCGDVNVTPYGTTTRRARTQTATTTTQTARQAVAMAKPGLPKMKRRTNCVDAPDYGKCIKPEDEDLLMTIQFNFDAEKKVCQPFVWSGCGGNGNRYETEESCQAACVDTEIIVEEENSATHTTPPSSHQRRGDVTTDEASYDWGDVADLDQATHYAAYFQVSRSTHACPEAFKRLQPAKSLEFCARECYLSYTTECNGFVFIEPHSTAAEASCLLMTHCNVEERVHPVSGVTYWVRKGFY